MDRLSGPNRHAANDNRTKSDFIETIAHVAASVMRRLAINLAYIGKRQGAPIWHSLYWDSLNFDELWPLMSPGLGRHLALTPDANKADT